MAINILYTFIINQTPISFLEVFHKWICLVMFGISIAEHQATLTSEGIWSKQLQFIWWINIESNVVAMWSTGVRLFVPVNASFNQNGFLKFLRNILWNLLQLQFRLLTRLLYNFLLKIVKINLVLFCLIDVSQIIWIFYDLYRWFLRWILSMSVIFRSNLASLKFNCGLFQLTVFIC